MLGVVDCEIPRKENSPFFCYRVEGQLLLSFLFNPRSAHTRSKLYWRAGRRARCTRKWQTISSMRNYALRAKTASKSGR